MSFGDFRWVFASGGAATWGTGAFECRIRRFCRFGRNCILCQSQATVNATRQRESDDLFDHERFLRICAVLNERQRVDAVCQSTASEQGVLSHFKMQVRTAPPPLKRLLFRSYACSKQVLRKLVCRLGDSAARCRRGGPAATAGRQWRDWSFVLRRPPPVARGPTWRWPPRSVGPGAAR